MGSSKCQIFKNKNNNKKILSTKYYSSYRQVIDLSIPMSDIPAWFTGAKLNWSENMLRCRSADKIALIGARSF